MLGLCLVGSIMIVSSRPIRFIRITLEAFRFFLPPIHNSSIFILLVIIKENDWNLDNRDENKGSGMYTNGPHNRLRYEPAAKYSSRMKW